MRNLRKSDVEILCRAAISEMAFDSAALAKIIGVDAARAPLPVIEQAIFALRDSVVTLGKTLREAEASIRGEAA